MVPGGSTKRRQWRTTRPNSSSRTPRRSRRSLRSRRAPGRRAALLVPLDGIGAPASGSHTTRPQTETTPPAMAASPLTTRATSIAKLMQFAAWTPWPAAPNTMASASCSILASGCHAGRLPCRLAAASAAGIAPICHCAPHAFLAPHAASPCSYRSSPSSRSAGPVQTGIVQARRAPPARPLLNSNLPPLPTSS